MKLDLTLSKIAKITGAELISSAPKTKVTAFVTDSRVIRPGDAFIALKGKNHDARQFIPDVLKKAQPSYWRKKGLNLLKMRTRPSCWWKIR